MLSFGKYKGWTYKQVCATNPSYIHWMAARHSTGNDSFDHFRDFCISVVERTFLYIILLSGGKYYIGTTSFPVHRLHKHREGTASSWTRKHRPEHGYSKLKLVPSDILPAVYEDMWVKQYMVLHGVDSVRGGSYSQIHLNKSQEKALREEIRHVLWHKRRLNTDESDPSTPIPQNKRPRTTPDQMTQRCLFH